MSLPEPETQGHASAQGAGVALDRDDPEGAIRHLKYGMSWIADVLVELEQRVRRLEGELDRGDPHRGAGPATTPRAGS